MNKSSPGSLSTLPRRIAASPIGLLSVFVVLVEVISGVSLNTLAATDSSYAGHLVFFVISFPLLVLIAYLCILVTKREVLYAPFDYHDPRGFERILEIERNARLAYARTDALIIDPRQQDKGITTVVTKLAEEKDWDACFHLFKGFLKLRQYIYCSDLVRLVMTLTDSGSSEYRRATKYLGYCFVGQRRYGDAIATLLRAVNGLSEEEVGAWPSIALAYAYRQTNDSARSICWMDAARRSQDFGEVVRYGKDYYGELLVNGTA